MKPLTRWGLYLLGLFFTALGINLTIRADLGVSPVSAFTLTLSKVAGVSLGTVTVVVYAFFVLAEVLLLGRRFKPKNLLQLVFNFAFGVFLDLTGKSLIRLVIHGYGMQLLWLLFGIAAIALGVVLFLSMDIVPNAPDGIVLAYCERTGANYSTAKFGFDCICVTLSILSSLLFLHRIISVREGTVLAALLTGRLVGLFAKPVGPWLRKAAFPSDAAIALAIQ
jgi:uncharacterized membrane protein YczE